MKKLPIIYFADPLTQVDWVGGFGLKKELLCGWLSSSLVLKSK